MRKVEPSTPDNHSFEMHAIVAFQQEDTINATRSYNANIRNACPGTFDIRKEVSASQVFAADVDIGSS
jgi:hypothetical protein